MQPLAVWSIDDVLPDFSTLALREIGPEQPPPPGEELLMLWALDGVASIVRAGVAWCDVGAVGGPHTVRLERWASEPPVDGGWDDLVETPYRSQRGRVQLSYFDSAPMGEGNLDLGGPGLHRLRIGRAVGVHHQDTWCFQFWPTPDPAAPRWLARSMPPVNHRRHQWRREFGDSSVQDLADIVGWAGGGSAVSVEDIAGWAAAHHREAGWLDDQLWSDPGAVLPLAHPERDAVYREQLPQIRADNARRGERLAGLARQLGVPAPQSRRDLLGVLVAAGVLEEADGRYRPAERVPRVQDVLDLPAERVEQLQRADDAKYTQLTMDVVSIALWTRSAPTTEAELTDLLLADAADVRGALDHGVRTGRFDVDGDRSDRFRLQVRRTG